jgi:hypothetical protein
MTVEHYDPSGPKRKLQREREERATSGAPADPPRGPGSATSSGHRWWRRPWLALLKRLGGLRRSRRPA